MSGLSKPGCEQAVRAQSSVEDRLERVKNFMDRLLSVTSRLEDKVAPRPCDPCCGEKAPTPRLALTTEVDILGDRLLNIVERLDEVYCVIDRQLGNIPLEY